MTRRRYLTTGIVALVFLALLGWVLTQERGRVAEKGEVLALQLTDVSELSVSGAQYGYTLERRDGEWWFTQPFEGLAEAEQAEGLVRAVATVQASHREGVDPQAPEFGLAQPQLTVTVKHRGERLTTLTLGAESPVGARVFASISDRPGLYLLESSFPAQLQRDPAELRERRLTGRLEAGKIRRVAVRRGEEEIVLQRVPLVAEPTWEITSPRKLRADRWVVEGLTTAPGNREAVDFLPYTEENLAACGLDQPQVTVTYAAEGGSAATIYLGREDQREVAAEPGAQRTLQPVVYAVRSGRPEILVFTTGLLQDLNKSLLDLRDRRLLALTPAEITGLTVQREEGLSFRLARAQDQWQVLAPRSGPADQYTVEDLLFTLTDLQAQDYVVEGNPRADLRPYGLSAPPVALIVQAQGRGAPLTVALGAPVPDQPGRRYARLSDRQDVYVVDDTLLRDLPDALEELLAPDLPAAEETEAGYPPGFSPGDSE